MVGGINVSTYLDLVVFLEMLEGVGPQDAVGDDGSHQHDVCEQACEDLPRIVEYRSAAVRSLLFLLHPTLRSLQLHTDIHYISTNKLDIITLQTLYRIGILF